MRPRSQKTRNKDAYEEKDKYTRSPVYFQNSTQ